MKRFLFIALLAAASVSLTSAAAAAQAANDLRGVWNGRMVSGLASTEMWLVLRGGSLCDL